MDAGTDIEVIYPSPGVVIDVSRARFIDSSFVNNVLKADRLARHQAKVLRLQIGTTPIVRRVLEISGIVDKLDCVDARDEALRSVVAGDLAEPG